MLRVMPLHYATTRDYIRLSSRVTPPNAVYGDMIYRLYAHLRLPRSSPIGSQVVTRHARGLHAAFAPSFRGAYHAYTISRPAAIFTPSGVFC